MLATASSSATGLNTGAAMPAEPPVALLSGVTVRYAGSASPAIADVTLEVPTNTVMAIIGPSGSGKSTLLSSLGLLTTLTAGSYELLGAETNALSNRRQAAFRAAHIGFVFQAYHLLSHLSVWENVRLGTRYAATPRAVADQRAAELLDLFGLGHRTAAHPRQLSGGEQQRVAIARALLNRPALMLCDEPTGNLDRSSAERVMRAIIDGQSARTGSTVIVTHDPWVAEQADIVHEMELPPR